tara:strand:+ start:174 stop:1307 length:1134 start_codon:yes stop_codon:yes gene_type:complete
MDSKITNVYMQMLKENSPKEEKAVEYTIDKIKELLDTMDIDRADPDQLKKLYNRIQTFSGYRPIRDTLATKKFSSSILKKFSGEIQALIEDLPEEDKVNFFKFLKEGDEVLFPEAESGNLYDILANVPGVSRSLAQQIMIHTGQDDKKRGVGMGEVAFALLFSNIDAATNKGDLELNGKEFEIKGENAALGATSDVIFKKRVKEASDYLNSKMGITVIDRWGYKVGEDEFPKLNVFPSAVSHAYKLAASNGAGDDFKVAFKGFLKIFGDFKDEILNSAVYDTIDLNNPKSIQRGIAVLNLYRYILLEGFPYFLAHDVGAGGKGTGNYVFASGSPEEIASKIYNNKNVKFEKVAYNGLRPRIGFLSRFAEDSEGKVFA